MVILSVQVATTERRLIKVGRCKQSLVYHVFLHQFFSLQFLWGFKPRKLVMPKIQISYILYINAAVEYINFLNCISIVVKGKTKTHHGFI